MGGGQRSTHRMNLKQGEGRLCCFSLPFKTACSKPKQEELKLIHQIHLSDEKAKSSSTSGWECRSTGKAGDTGEASSKSGCRIYSFRNSVALELHKTWGSSNLSFQKGFAGLTHGCTEKAQEKEPWGREAPPGYFPNREAGRELLVTSLRLELGTAREGRRKSMVHKHPFRRLAQSSFQVSKTAHCWG